MKHPGEVAWGADTALALLLAAVARGQQVPTPERTEPPRSATAPFILDHGRMIVQVELVRSDGSVRRASAWVDTGSQFLSLSVSLARDLGLAAPPPTTDDDGGHSVESPSPAPPLRLAGLPLNVEGVRVRIHPGAHVRPGVPAEATLPASVLRDSHVIFDYPARRLTVARPGTLAPGGLPVPCRVQPETGLFLIEATLDGEAVPLGVDTGSAGTWVSTRLTTAWKQRHPHWPSAVGAVGSTNFFGFSLEVDGVLMQLPEVGIGSLRARNVALLGVSQDLFDWYSTKSAGPVVGFLGANVLRRFRLEVDFPGRTTYWEAGSAVAAGDLDIVGLTLRAEADGRLTIAGVAKRAGRPTVTGIEPGDTLLEVGELEVAKATMGEVIDALRGDPGDTRRLVVEQDGEQVTVEAPVTHFP
jgi:hypothetical protein